ncbi:MFS transporter [candidate division WOR-3 bacterium]|nr:MFS transporter [candidate division WOR-3 bacterium]
MVNPVGILQKTHRVFRYYLSNIHLFSLNARLFLVGTFFWGMGFSGFMLLFNLYLKELGYAESNIGNIISATTLGTVLMAIPASILLRRLPIKPLLLMSTPIAVLSYAIQVTSSQYQIILAGGLIAGLAAAFSRIAAAPFFMRNSTARERPYLFSVQFALMLLAGIIGNLLGGFSPGLIQRSGMVPYLTYRYTLLIFSGLVLAAVVPISFIKQKPPLRPARMKIHSMSMIAKLFVPNLIVGIGAGLSIPFLNLYFKDYFNTPAYLIGIFYSLQQFLMIAGLLAAPLIAERAGKIKTVVISQLISIPFLIILGTTRNLPLAVLAFLMRAAFMNMAQPLYTNFAMEKVHHEDQALTNALLTVAFTAGWGASANLGGYLIEHFSYALPFFATSILYLISTGITYRLFGRATAATRTAHTPTTKAHDPAALQ